MYSYLSEISQHGIKAAGRRAKACPSQRAGFLAGLGAGRVGSMDLAGIKWLSLMVQTPSHGQAVARLGVSALMSKNPERSQKPVQKSVKSWMFNFCSAWSLFALKEPSQSCKVGEQTKGNYRQQDAYESDCENQSRVTSMKMRAAVKHLLRVCDIALGGVHFGGIRVGFINDRFARAFFPNGNANACDQKNSEYPNNKFHAFQHMVEKADFQGGSPCYS